MTRQIGNPGSAAPRPSQPVYGYLFVIPWSLDRLGGVNQVVINLARQMMLAQTFDPIVLVTDWQARKPVWETVHGVRTVRWRVRPPWPGPVLTQRLTDLYWRLRFRAEFRAFCRQHRIAVINAHYPTDAALTLQRLSRAFEPAPRTITSFHGTDLTGLAASNPDHVNVWRRAMAMSHGVVACSAAFGHRLQQLLQVSVTVIHNGIDAPAFTRLAGRRAAGGRRTILNVGKFEFKKGQDILIRAFAQFAEAHPDVDLVLVGADDDALESLQQLCLTLGVEHRVQFRVDVPHSEVATCFAQATIFALPSRQEPFGIVLLEAGCIGLPVVASAVGGVPEILEDGMTARLVHPDRPDELSTALQAMLADPQSASVMGRRLQAHVVQKFSWATAHSRYIGLAGHAAGANPVHPG